MHVLLHILRRIDRTFEEAVLITTLSLITVIVFCQVILRYVFSFVPPFMDELSIWLFIWTIWIGVAYCFKHGLHIRITVGIDWLSPRPRLVVEIIVDLIVLAFFIYMFWWGYVQATSSTIMMQRSTVISNPFTGTQLSMSLLYAAVPIGSLLACYRLVVSLYHRFSGKA